MALPRSALAVVFLVLVLVLLPSCLAEPVGFGELEEEWRGEIDQVSWKPRAFVARGFLTDAECDHIIKVATPKMEESAVVDNETGKAKKSNVRTSTGTFFARAADEVITRIEKRVAQVTMIPMEHQEGLQVLHYQNGQKYEAHMDYFHDSHNQRLAMGGQRVLTMLMYLSTPDEGGETVFPDAENKVSGPGWSECALKGLAHKPVKGDALMFYSLTPDGNKDPASLHGSCPTLKGNKWSATKWIHVFPFGVAPKAAPKPGDCVDDNDQCKEWAFFNECEKNPGFMKVSCKKSCRVCGDDKPTMAPIKQLGSEANVATT